MPVTKKITDLALANVAAGDDVPIAQGGFLKRAKAGQANGFALLDNASALLESSGYLYRGAFHFNDVNWNTLNKTGIYQSVDVGTGGANQPPATYRWGHLIVMGNGLAWTQIYIPHNPAGDGYIYIRVNQDGDNPSSWRKIAAPPA